MLGVVTAGVGKNDSIAIPRAYMGKENLLRGASPIFWGVKLFGVGGGGKILF